MMTHATTNYAALSKVQEITHSFWIFKIAATTLGEAGGDSITISHSNTPVRCDRLRSAFPSR